MVSILKPPSNLLRQQQQTSCMNQPPSTTYEKVRLRRRLNLPKHKNRPHPDFLNPGIPEGPPRLFQNKSLVASPPNQDERFFRNLLTSPSMLDAPHTCRTRPPYNEPTSQPGPSHTVTNQSSSSSPILRLQPDDSTSSSESEEGEH